MQQIISNSSHWRYLFSATNHNHLNSDETIQNSIHLFFFIFYMEHQSDYWLYYLERLYRLELWRKKRINLCSNIWHILNCSILMDRIDMPMIKTLKKNSNKKFQPLSFKNTHPYTILQPYFIIYWTTSSPSKGYK